MPFFVSSWKIIVIIEFEKQNWSFNKVNHNGDGVWTQSAGAHGIRYYFTANLHTTEWRSTLFLTRYDKNNIVGWKKRHSKTKFSLNDWKSSRHCEN